MNGDGGRNATMGKETTGYIDKEVKEREGEQMRRVRIHRCSRCGAEGHNVRVCPTSSW